MKINKENIEFVVNEGVVKGLQSIFDYHYNAILRDVINEVSYLDYETRNDICDYVTEYLEDFMNWPDDIREDIFLNPKNTLLK